MVSKIEPDRYADTGFAIADTPADLNAFLFQKMMSKTGAERLIIGCQMADSARELVWSGIPRDLPEEERRTRFLQRFYGDSVLMTNDRSATLRSTIPSSRVHLNP